MDAIYKRRAVRSFNEGPVNNDLLMKLLRAAVQAPSAMNRQPWAFVIIEGRELLREYSTRANNFCSLLWSPDLPYKNFVRVFPIASSIFSTTQAALL
jgi:nitroreductase